jgi:hypothetical protein
MDPGNITRRAGEAGALFFIIILLCWSIAMCTRRPISALITFYWHGLVVREAKSNQELGDALLFFGNPSIFSVTSASGNSTLTCHAHVRCTNTHQAISILRRVPLT